MTTTQDPLATAASADGVPVFKFKSWRLKGVARPEVIKVLKLHTCKVFTT